MPRTSTYFWSSDDLAPILEEAKKLRADYKDRILHNQFMPLELRLAATDRIDNLDLAIRFMADKAD